MKEIEEIKESEQDELEAKRLKAERKAKKLERKANRLKEELERGDSNKRFAIFLLMLYFLSALPLFYSKASFLLIFYILFLSGLAFFAGAFFTIAKAYYVGNLRSGRENDETTIDERD
jgi:hypothetical protein